MRHETILDRFQQNLAQGKPDLWLREKRITDRVVRPLVADSRLERIEYLSLSSNSIGVKGAKALASSPYFTRLLYLNLSNNKIRDAGVHYLAASRAFPRLTCLSLENTGIKNAGAITLAQSPHLTTLHRLTLSHNKISKRGIEALATSPNFPLLRKLDLWGNDLADEDVAALAASPWLAKLEVFDFYSMSLSDEACLRVAERGRNCAIQGPALAAALAADPANLFLLARLFLERGRVVEPPLFAALDATPPTSLFWGWLERQAEQVSDLAVSQALSFFPTNACLQQRASFCRRRDVSLEEALF